MRGFAGFRSRWQHAAGLNKAQVGRQFGDGDTPREIRRIRQRASIAVTQVAAQRDGRRATILRRCGEGVGAQGERCFICARRVAAWRWQVETDCAAIRGGQLHFGRFAGIDLRGEVHAHTIARVAATHAVEHAASHREFEGRTYAIGEYLVGFAGHSIGANACTPHQAHLGIIRQGLRARPRLPALTFPLALGELWRIVAHRFNTRLATQCLHRLCCGSFNLALQVFGDTCLIDWRIQAQQKHATLFHAVMPCTRQSLRDFCAAGREFPRCSAWKAASIKSLQGITQRGGATCTNRQITRPLVGEASCVDPTTLRCQGGLSACAFTRDAEWHRRIRLAQAHHVGTKAYRHLLNSPRFALRREGNNLGRALRLRDECVEREHP